MKIKIGNKTFEVSKEALESNPEEITIDFNGILRTDDEEISFVENHKKDARKEGVEIAVKDYREKFGFQGRSIEKLIEAVQTKTLDEAKIEPDEKVRKMTLKLSEKEIALTSALQKVGEVETSFNSYKDKSFINTSIDECLPEKTILPKADMKLILQSKLNFGITENGKVGVKDISGNFIKNKTTADVMEAKEVIEDFFKTNQQYIKGVDGGAGEGDDGSGNKKQTVDSFIKEQQEKGVKINSDEFNTVLENRVEQGLIEVA